MTRTFIIVAALAVLATVLVGSIASAKMASTQFSHDGVRVAMNSPAVPTQTDATPGIVTRELGARAYCFRAANVNELGAFYTTRQCSAH